MHTLRQHPLLLCGRLLPQAAAVRCVPAVAVRVRQLLPQAAAVRPGPLPDVLPRRLLPQTRSTTLLPRIAKRGQAPVVRSTLNALVPGTGSEGARNPSSAVAPAIIGMSVRGELAQRLSFSDPQESSCPDLAIKLTPIPGSGNPELPPFLVNLDESGHRLFGGTLQVLADLSDLSADRFAARELATVTVSPADPLADPPHDLSDVRVEADAADLANILGPLTHLSPEQVIQAVRGFVDQLASENGPALFNEKLPLVNESLRGLLTALDRLLESIESVASSIDFERLEEPLHRLESAVIDLPKSIDQKRDLLRPDR